MKGYGSIRSLGTRLGCKYCLLSTAVFPIALMPGTAFAQDVSTPTDGISAAVPIASQPATSSTQVQEIIVTAQRRSQNLQEVPLAVTAFNAKTLASAGITNVGGIAQVDPSVNFGASTGVVLPFLRGVGNPSATAIGNESSVPVYIDDVYYTRLSGAYLELADVERVEVLKGPQGTLFGRNASGGAIQVFTRDPGEKEAFEATVGYANFDTATGKLYASKPLGEDGGIDLSVSGRHQGDGWGEGIYNGNKTYQYNFINIRSKFLYHVTPTTTVRVIGFYMKSFTEVGNTAGRYRGTFGSTAPFYGPSQIVSPASNFYDTTDTVDPYERTKGYGGSVKIDQELGFAQTTSITAYRKATETNHQDGENTPLDYQSYSLNPRDRQISEELQLKSNTSSRISWIVGGFYLNSRQGFSPANVTGGSVTELVESIGLPVAPGARESLNGVQQVNSLAGFGQITAPITPTTNVTLGARYTHDRVGGVGTVSLVDPGVVTIPFSTYDKTFVFKKFTYRAAIDQKIADRVRVYGSVSRGYKSGTFNTLPLTADPSKPETVDAYEIGIKSELLDRRLRLNAAVFQNNIDNPQVQTVLTDPETGASFVGLTNAKKARSRGFEVNADAVIANGLSARLGATYLDAKYTNFTNAPFYYPIVNGTCPGGVSAGGYAAGLCPAISGDATGHRLVQVPKWRLSGGVNYTLEASAGKASLDLNASYTGKYFWDADNLLAQRGYTLINASLTLTPASNENLSVRLWANNITTRKYYTYELPVSGGAGYIAAPGAPRTFGVEFGIKI